MAFRRRRWFGGAILILAGGIGLLVGRPLYLVSSAWLHDRPAPANLPIGYVDDASRMNSTKVAEVWDIPTEPADAEAQLRDLLGRARSEHRPVAISGARHSMGGHTLYPDGIVLNMLPFRHLELDAARALLRAGAGARWSDIVPYLDDRGLSVGVMQSNNNFTVGGSLSVNCHGWQPNRPPIASTVESFRLMRPDGTVVRCSRAQNVELFSLALGGYGLFGVILDADLRVVPNERYRAEVRILPSDRLAEWFREKAHDAGTGMAYGRLCVVPGDQTFLREAVVTAFRRAPCTPDKIPPLEESGLQTLRREVYRAQIDSPAGKKLRWQAERRLGAEPSQRYFSRNQLLNEGVEVYQEQGAARTDILHEYFVPLERAGEFLARLRVLAPQHEADLLNITVRHVLSDPDTFLRYADAEMLTFVMLFSQPRTPDAESRMEALTRDMIDAALLSGGRYYLPYRLHATREQFNRAYPQGKAFFERKRHYDPEEILQNQFSKRYVVP
jgi:FAD/FMN-containing dehydrogenase